MVSLQKALLKIYPWLLGLPATLLVAYATSLHGIGLTPDSVSYILLARDIAENGFAFLSHGNFVLWPPFYPILLALGAKVTHSDPLLIARWLNFLIAWLTVGLVGKSAAQFTKNHATIIFVSLLASFSIPLQFVWGFAWTEPLFIFLVLAILYLLSSSEEWNFSKTLLLSLLISLAVMTRYIGVVLIPLAPIALWMRKELKRKEWLFSSAVTTLIPSYLFGLYALRNYFFTGTFLGHRQPSFYSLEQNLRFTRETLMSWLGEDFLPFHFTFKPFSITQPLLFKIALLTALALPLCALFRQRREFLKLFKERATALHLLYTLFYCSFLIYTSTTTQYDPIRSRLLSPVAGSLLLLAIPFGRFFYTTLSQPDLLKRVTLILLSLFALFLLISPLLPYERMVCFNGALALSLLFLLIYLLLKKNSFIRLIQSALLISTLSLLLACIATNSAAAAMVCRHEGIALNAPKYWEPALLDLLRRESKVGRVIYSHIPSFSLDSTISLAQRPYRYEPSLNAETVFKQYPLLNQNLVFIAHPYPKDFFPLLQSEEFLLVGELKPVAGFEAGILYEVKKR